jgi:hypothetical protein
MIEIEVLRSCAQHIMIEVKRTAVKKNAFHTRLIYYQLSLGLKGNRSIQGVLHSNQIKSVNS